MKARTEPLTIILLGDPAAGKATQAKRLIARYGLYDLDMGREVRRPSVRALYDYAGTTAKGILTPTHIVRSIFQKIIFSVPLKKGILFDGTPKMPGEARVVAKWLKDARRPDPVVLYLHIPVAEMLRRTRGRGRADDAVSALKNRFAYYRTKVAKTIVFFKKKYVFVRVSGMGSREAVEGRIDAAVEKFINGKKRTH